MRAFLYILAAISGYLVSGWNPAITFSKAIYKKDIRECGSGNPGFTNFRRSFGNRYAWHVLVLDLSKAALVIALFAGCGRTKASEIISGGLVFVGGIQAAKNDLHLKDGDTISLRGKGKATLSVGGTSKKDRIFITLNKRVVMILM